MMYIEKDLQLFPEPDLTVVKFDDPYTHGLSSFNMKAVDFIIEYPDKYVFLELKDPNHPNTRSRENKDFKAELKTDNFKADMAKKYRDTFIYHWAQKRIEKPIHYYVLVSLKGLKTEHYLTLTDELKKHLPLHYPKKWKRPLAYKCAVLSLKDWNKLFPECIIRRRSLMRGN